MIPRDIPSYSNEGRQTADSAPRLDGFEPVQRITVFTSGRNHLIRVAPPLSPSNLTMPAIAHKICTAMAADQAKFDREPVASLLPKSSCTFLQ